MHSLSASYFLFFAFIGIFISYFSLYCEAIGFSASEIGYFLAAYAAMKCVAPIFWTVLADRTRRRKELIILAGWVGVAIFLCFFFTTDFWIMFFLILLFGFFRAPLVPLMEATTWEHLPARGWEYGKIRQWGSIGFVLATLISGILSDAFSIRFILYLMLAFLIAQAFFFFRVPGQLDTVDMKKMSLRSFLGGPAILIFLSIGFFAQISHGMFYGFFSLHMEHIGAGKPIIGFIWALSIGCEVLVLRFYKSWFKGIRPMYAIALAAAAGALRWFVMSRTANLPILIVIQSLHGLTFGASHVASLTYLHDALPKELNTKSQGLYSAITYGLGIMIGSLLGGPIYDHSGGFVLFAWAGWFAVIALALALTHLAAFKNTKS